MRKMINHKTKETVEVIEHIITRNFWEYYVLNSETNSDDIKLCYVLGFENEFGDVYLPELKPYIISRTKKLDSIAPATGYDWSQL